MSTEAQPQAYIPEHLSGVDRWSQAYQLVTGCRGNRYTVRSRSPNTWLTAAVGVRSVKRYCEAKGYVPLPIDIAHLEEWIIDLADRGRTIKTIRTYLGGVCTWHRRHGYLLQTRLLLDTLKGIEAGAGPVQQSKPLMAADLHEILDHLDRDRVADVRAGALLCLLLTCSLRSAEACALDWQRQGDNRERDVNRGFIAEHPKGLEVVLTRTKTSREPQRLPVPVARMPRTVEWVRRWVELTRVQAGEPLIRALRKGGKGGIITGNRLAPKAVTAIVRYYMAQHLIRTGMDPAMAMAAALDYSSHAGRAGFLSTGAAAGTKEWQLRERSRHKTPTVAAGYVRLQSGWDTDWGFEL
jgi:integrase